MSVGDTRGRPLEQKTAIVLGELFPKESSEPRDTMVAQLQTSIPQLEVLAGPATVPAGVLGRQWDRLVVWDDVVDVSKGPYAWSPAQFDLNRPLSTLAEWMDYPWGSPDQMILPGFHTLAESGLGKNATGQEIYLAVCGMMSTGTRTILMSRWRLGGASTTELTREFVRELPHLPASTAWQRAVQLCRAATLDVELESRYRKTSSETTVSADHPFFWAGYMLVDTGAIPDDFLIEDEQAP